MFPFVLGNYCANPSLAMPIASSGPQQPKLIIATTPAIQPVGYDQYRMTPEHPRPGIAHDCLDFCAPLGLIAMHGAGGADWFILLKGTA